MTANDIRFLQQIGAAYDGPVEPERPVDPGWDDPEPYEVEYTVEDGEAILDVDALRGLISDNRTLYTNLKSARTNAAVYRNKLEAVIPDARKAEDAADGWKAEAIDWRRKAALWRAAACIGWAWMAIIGALWVASLLGWF